LSPDGAGAAVGLRFTGDRLPGLNDYSGDELPAVATVAREWADGLP
jgi:hypothetical protein